MRKSLLLAILLLSLTSGGCGTEVSFNAGIASGDVTATEVTLWTVVDGANSVKAEVFNDPSLKELVTTVDVEVIYHGVAKVHVSGLQPASRYYYRFTTSSKKSDVGTFTTASLPDMSSSVVFAFSGCSNALFQPFKLLSAVLEDKPDFFIYLGDTIYSDDSRHALSPAFTFDEYNSFYLENRRDVHLRKLLGSTSVYAMWDDHEVKDNFAGETVDPFQFANALQSFIINLPVRESTDKYGRLYRSFRWGKLAEFFMLDVRSYRSAEIICKDKDGEPLLIPDSNCRKLLNAQGRTFLGNEQKSWLMNSLISSDAVIKFIVSGVPITGLKYLPYDRWEGYPVERREILDFINESNMENVFFLASDIHANLVTTVEKDIKEIITGPIATDTLQDYIEGAGIEFSLELIKFLFPNIEFIEINRFAYTLVHVIQNNGKPIVKIQIKGDNGEALFTKQFSTK